MTARRDLAILARSGQARRTHGGAVLPDLAAHEDGFRHRLELETDRKRRIAAAVIGDARAGRVAVHRLLDDARGMSPRRSRPPERALTILTNSLPVITLVGAAGVPNLDLVALGGSFRSLTHSFVGPDVVRALRGYRADRLLFAVKGITEDGHLTDAGPLEAEVKRAMMANAKTGRAAGDGAEVPRSRPHGRRIGTGRRSRLRRRCHERRLPGAGGARRRRAPRLASPDGGGPALVAAPRSRRPLHRAGTHAGPAAPGQLARALDERRQVRDQHAEDQAGRPRRPGSRCR